MASFFTPKKSALKVRARSIPYKRPFVVALVYTLFFYLALATSLTAACGYFLTQTKFSAYLIAGTIASSLLFWFVSFLKRRRAHCALCQGTPYLNTGAHLHEKASKLPLLNHGHSNMIRSLFSLQYRCMYCGTPYDFLKTMSHKHHRD